MQSVSSVKIEINMNKLSNFKSLIKSALFLAFVSFNVHAIALQEINCLEVSSSYKSIIIDRGNLEDFKEGMIAKFYVQKGPKENPTVFLVAEGELVKSFPRKSYWYLKNTFIVNALKKDSSLLLHTLSAVVEGRPLKIRTKHVVASDQLYKDLDDYLDKNQENVPNKLIKEQSAYASSTDLIGVESKSLDENEDVLIQTFENYQSKSGNYYSEEYGDLTGQNFFIGSKSVKLGDIKNAEDKILFESMSEGYLKKTNNMKFGIKSFYRDQEKIDHNRELNKKSLFNNVFEDVNEEKRLAEVINPRAVAKVSRDGEQWSSDMDDISLRRYFIKTGLEKETRRRELALNELEGHEVMLHFSGVMNSHGKNTDPNYQGKGYTIGVSYDLHLGRTSPNLKNWSLQFILETGTQDYNLGVLNARAKETFYGSYLNYYFINNPLTLNSFIYLAGIGIKNGSASIYSPDLSKEYSYQLLILPALQVMTKYRFRSGDLSDEIANIGASLNFALNIDGKNLSVIDRLSDEINSKFFVYDIKYTLGLSVYF
jgi:hypothetical protein